MGNTIRRFTVLVASGTGMFTVDGLEFGGKLWLVPKWIAEVNGPNLKPARMIRFDTLRFQRGALGHEYMLNAPIPQAVLDGPEAGQYEILEGDAISFGILDERPKH